jgi:hypothetical protein
MGLAKKDQRETNRQDSSDAVGRDSFRSAEANVGSGIKNAITWRIPTIAKSAMASPTHVAREIFVGSEGRLEAKGNCAARLAVSMDLC